MLPSRILNFGTFIVTITITDNLYYVALRFKAC